MLENIMSYENKKKLNQQELTDLCAEIRRVLIRTVSENGGHLASNLGVVELTVALHRIYDTPRDRIVFDVGHQSYVHKMITGRFNQFSTLRKHGGLAGFPRRGESEYDCFETGHASTAISAALGIARARDFLNESYHVVALVGDGALTGGMCYEALNDAGNKKTQLTVILNDNEMSIARNVGALSSYLTHLRISAGWQSTKNKVRRITKIPFIGKGSYRIIHGTKKALKSILLKNRDIGFFEALGFQYFGPIDGHDLKSLEDTLLQAKQYKGPCVIHVLTQKGNGYEQAEQRPEAFHGTPPFFIETGDRLKEPEFPSSGHRMADCLSDLADKNDRIVAITAAMPLGTGLDHFAQKHPDRLIDVGIAEEHAATMAAGLAVGGMRPYFAVYSSFFQRCYDQMIHDVAMQHLPVVFLLDRSGIGSEDGQTHHGIFDLSALLPVPDLVVLSPCDADELCRMLPWTLQQNAPVAIRYGKDGNPVPDYPEQAEPFVAGKWEVMISGDAPVILAVGSMVRIAADVAGILHKYGYHPEVVNCSSIKPADISYLRHLKSDIPVFTMEEHMLTGGFGEYITQKCIEINAPVPAACFGIPEMFIQHGSHSLLLEDAGLSPTQIADRIIEILRRE